MFQFREHVPDYEKKGFVNSGPLNWHIFRFGNMVPEIEIKVSESGTITQIGNIDFNFGTMSILIYLFIYLLFIYLFIYLLFTFFNQELTIP